MSEDQAPNFATALLLHKLDGLETLVVEQHGRVRSDMASNVTMIRADISALTVTLNQTRDRVLVVETERASEKGVSDRRLAWLALGASAVTAVLMKVFDFFHGK